MDKEELKEIIHDEIGTSLESVAKSLKKEKKKPDYGKYVECILFSSFMIYILYLIYKTATSIDMNIF